MRKASFSVIYAIAVAFLLVSAFWVLPISAQTETRPKTIASPTPTPPVIKEEDQVIKIETDLVNLNVRVVDRNNRPINGLKQGEFKVFEDNEPQRIEFFSTSEVPTNYTLVVDNSGSLRTQIEKVIEAGKILVAANRPADETSIIRFVNSEKIEILQDFTPNKTDLDDALDNMYIDGGQTAVIDAVYLATQKVTQYEKSASKDDRKRRALILVSDGEDRASYYSVKQLFDLLRESDVQIYVIGFIGDLDKEGGFIGKSPQGKAKAFLEKIASETGGKAYFPETTAELPRLASEIASELRTQYSIGYSPTNEKADGTFRNIKVTVDDGPSSQKRIAITKVGRVADSDGKSSPTPNQANKNN